MGIGLGLPFLLDESKPAKNEKGGMSVLERKVLFLGEKGAFPLIGSLFLIKKLTLSASSCAITKLK